MNPQSRKINQLFIGSVVFILIIIVSGLLLPSPFNSGQDSPPQGAGIIFAPTHTALLVGAAQNGTPNPADGSTPTPTHAVTPVLNCTYTHFYWKDHPDLWLAENIQIGRSTYTKSEAIAILRRESPDVTTDVLKQFLAAWLNTLKGADAAAIEATLNEASSWLSKYTLGIDIPAEERENGLRLATALQDYNVGHTGPGPCRDEPSTPTPLASPTGTPTPTPTASRTPIPRFPTPTGTEPQSTPGPPQPPPVTPTNTLSPTNPPPLPPPVTGTAPPPATSTPTPPPSTPTLAPPEIPTPPVPNPTAQPTLTPPLPPPTATPTSLLGILTATPTTFIPPGQEKKTPSVTPFP